jgi:alpha-beta hydrolase superfamily lysophospholipase
MDASARLIDVAIPAEPEGIVLLLHGGGSRGAPVRVSPTQLSVLRMIPIAQRVARAGRGRLAVLRLLNTWRGWDSSHTPVSDLAWALGQLEDRFGPGLPVCLIGHSLGGRAALLAAGDPRVRGVVALAPWVYPDDAPRGPDVAGTPVLIIHGEEDRVASMARSRALADRLEQRTDVSFVSVPGGKHAMLTHRDAFDGRAGDAAASMLLVTPR